MTKITTILCALYKYLYYSNCSSVYIYAAVLYLFGLFHSYVLVINVICFSLITNSLIYSVAAVA